MDESNPIKHRLAELSARAGNYTLLFLSFATVAAVTFLQIPIDSHFIARPNYHMVSALKMWMLSAIPLILAILPVSEIVNEKHLPKLARLKFTMNWLGMIQCIVGIVFFLLGISY